MFPWKFGVHSSGPLADHLQLCPPSAPVILQRCEGEKKKIIKEKFHTDAATRKRADLAVNSQLCQCVNYSGQK